jgi:hypothetical protein
VAEALEALAFRPVARHAAGLAMVLRPAMWILAVAVAAVDTRFSGAWHRVRKSSRLRWHRIRKKMFRVIGAAPAGR